MAGASDEDEDNVELRWKKTDEGIDVKQRVLLGDVRQATLYKNLDFKRNILLGAIHSGARKYRCHIKSWE